MEMTEREEYADTDLPPPYNIGTEYDSAPEEDPLLEQSSTRLRSVQPPALDLPLPIQSCTERPTIGRKPTLTLCPQCGIQITTHIDYAVGWKTYLISFMLAALGCFCCCCLPYCTDYCKKANHYCPRCGIFLYSYNGFK